MLDKLPERLSVSAPAMRTAPTFHTKPAAGCGSGSSGSSRRRGLDTNVIVKLQTAASLRT